MAVILDTTKGRRQVSSELEGRRIMYREATQDSTITGYQTGILMPDISGAQEKTRRETRTVRKTENIGGIVINDVETPETVEAYAGSDATPMKNLEDYFPSIKTVKDIPGVTVDVLKQEGYTVRLAKTGNRLHTMIFTKKGVRVYSKKISPEKQDSAFGEEEMRIAYEMAAEEAVRQGKASKIYNIILPKFEKRLVVNRSKRNEGDTILFQRFIKGSRYNARELAGEENARSENEALLDPRRWRDQQRRKSYTLKFSGATHEVYGETIRSMYKEVSGF